MISKTKAERAALLRAIVEQGVADVLLDCVEELAVRCEDRSDLVKAKKEERPEALVAAHALSLLVDDLIDLKIDVENMAVEVANERAKSAAVVARWEA